MTDSQMRADNLASIDEIQSQLYSLRNTERDLIMELEYLWSLERTYSAQDVKDESQRSSSRADAAKAAEMQQSEKSSVKCSSLKPSTKRWENYSGWSQ